MGETGLHSAQEGLPQRPACVTGHQGSVSAWVPMLSLAR